ncbi:unnamed protein product [Chrysoparadoxa australica]
MVLKKLLVLFLGILSAQGAEPEAAERGGAQQIYDALKDAETKLDLAFMKHENDFASTMQEITDEINGENGITGGISTAIDAMGTALQDKVAKLKDKIGSPSDDWENIDPPTIFSAIGELLYNVVIPPEELPEPSPSPESSQSAQLS